MSNILFGSTVCVRHFKTKIWCWHLLTFRIKAFHGLVSNWISYSYARTKAFTSLRRSSSPNHRVIDPSSDNRLLEAALDSDECVLGLVDHWGLMNAGQRRRKLASGLRAVVRLGNGVRQSTIFVKQTPAHLMGPSVIIATVIEEYYSLGGYKSRPPSGMAEIEYYHRWLRKKEEKQRDTQNSGDDPTLVTANGWMRRIFIHTTILTDGGPEEDIHTT